MSRLNERLTLVANVSVVVSIVFLAIQMRENTRAIQGQTRDSITEKQMDYLGWRATSPDLAAAILKSSEGFGALTPLEQTLYSGYAAAQIREWENSHYQYTRGLFSTDDYLARTSHCRRELANPAMRRAMWPSLRPRVALGFREAIDSIVAQIDSEGRP